METKVLFIGLCVVLFLTQTIHGSDKVDGEVARDEKEDYGLSELNPDKYVQLFFSIFSIFGGKGEDKEDDKKEEY